VLYLQGQSFTQIAKKMNLTNPDVADVAGIVGREFPARKPKIGSGFSVTVWAPPTRSTFWEERELDWADLRKEAEGWMRVRHRLAHGLAGGWRSEVWPGPGEEGRSACIVGASTNEAAPS